MIIDTCLIACNLNKNYYQYYPLQRIVWKELCGIQTKLILVGDHIPSYLQPYADEIILFPPFDGLHDVFLAQILREFYPCVMRESQGIIISDADMLPMSKRYYLDTVRDIPQDKFVVYRDGVINQYGEIPMCYIAGSSQAFRNLFKCETVDDIKQTIKQIAQAHLDSGSTFDGQHGGKGWFVDQWNLFKTLEHHQPASDIVRLTDHHTGFRRLDRDQQIYWDCLRQHQYDDYHMPRWLPQHLGHIQHIIKELLPHVELPTLTFE